MFNLIFHYSLVWAVAVAFAFSYKMKTVLIITHIPYWLKNTGDGARLFALVNYLKRHALVVVAFGGVADKNDPRVADSVDERLTTVFIGEGKPLQIETYSRLFQRFMEGKTFDVCIVEHIFLSFLLPFIPRGTKLMLDAHDIVSERVKSFRQYGYSTASPMNISEEDEIGSFGRYHKVILLQQNEYDKVCRMIGREKVLLAPHPASLRRHSINGSVRHIGYVASNYAPNVNALSWFLKNVWPMLCRYDVPLKVYGNIGEVFRVERSKGVIVNGFEPDISAIYDEIDIVINPVFFGAGLKIKNVEALANGLPLVTTSHGAQGLESGLNTAFLAADEPQSFARHMINLITDHDLRRSIGEQAYEFAEERFSTECCFGELLAEINKN